MEDSLSEASPGHLAAPSGIKDEKRDAEELTLGSIKMRSPVECSASLYRTIIQRVHFLSLSLSPKAARGT
jgi:hypothetical protein